MFSSEVTQAHGVTILRELPPFGSPVIYLDVVSRPTFKCFKLKLENYMIYMTEGDLLRETRQSKALFEERFKNQSNV